MILGVGTDIVNTQRIADIYKKYGNDFLIKNFHIEEINAFKEIASSNKISFLSKRFAGKEAYAKALGSGIGQNIAFKDIAILNDEKGAPYIKIEAMQNSNSNSNNIHISLSDDAGFAVAFVVISKYYNLNSS